MKKLFTSPFSQKKIFSIFDALDLKQILSSDSERLLIVVPNRRYKTLLERHIFEYTGSNGFIHPIILSIDDLWLGLIHENLDALSFEKKWQRELIISKAMDQFPEFQNRLNKHSWIPVLDKTIIFWEQRMDITNPDYLNSDWMTDLNSERISLFAQFYQAYDSLGFSCNLISRERLRKYLPESTDYFKSFEHIVFLSLDEWIFDHWKYLIDQTADTQNVIFSIDRFDDAKLPYQEDVISRLLSSGYSITEKSLTAEPKVRNYKSVYGNRVDEIHAIASTIRNLNKDGQSLHSICVVLKEPDKYLSWIQKIFREHNLSFNFSAGLPVSETAISQLLFVQCELISGELTPQLLKKYCSNPISGLGYLVKLIDLIAAGYGDFSTVPEINAIIDIIESRVRKNQSNNSDGNPFIHCRKTIDILKNVVESISINQLKFSKAADNKERTNILRAWMLGRINQNKIKDRDLFNYASWTAFQQILNLFEKLSDFDPKSLAISNQDYLSILKRQLTQLTWNEPVRDGVQVLGPLEVKGMDFDVVFIPGLHSRIYPEISHERFFFSAEEIQLFNDSMKIDKNLIEENEFVQLIQKPNQSLFVSYSPSSDFPDEGPSLFLQLLEQGKEFESVLSVPAEDCRTKILNLTPNNFEFHNERRKYLEHIRQYGDATRFDGMVGNKLSLSLIGEYFRSKNNTISATEFDKYANCGFLYFSDRLLGINQEDDYSEGYDSKTRGTIFHKILQRFFDKSNGVITNSQITPDNISEKWDILVRLAEETVMEFDVTGHVTFHKDQLLKRITNAEISPLRSFLDLEMKRSEFAQVMEAEFDFGNDAERKLPSIDTLLGKFSIKGRIDRIDKMIEQKSYIIYDYKLSEKDGTAKLIEYEKSYQFLVYSYAVKELLGNAGGSFYYSLKTKYEEPVKHLSDFWGDQSVFKQYSQKSRKGFKAENISEYHSLIDRVPDLLGKQINMIATGIFKLNNTAHVDKSGFACPSYCSLSTACRKDEQRIAFLNRIPAGDHE